MSASFGLTHEGHAKKAGQWAAEFKVPDPQLGDAMATDQNLLAITRAVNGMVAVRDKPVPFPGARGVQGGVLLHGPPGCGKTYLAKAAAARLGLPFLMVQPAHIRGVYYGETSRALASLVEGGKKVAADGKGAVLFFDEIEAYGKRTGDPELVAVTALISDLLKFMDDVAATPQVHRLCIMTATNLVDACDPALRSRMSQVLEILPPARDARRAYLIRQFVAASEAGFDLPYQGVLERMLDATEGRSMRVLGQAFDRANAAWLDAGGSTSLLDEILAGFEGGNQEPKALRESPEGYA